MLSANLYAKERRGATLIIQRKSDQIKNTRLKDTPWETSAITGIKGELITVKPNSLLLLDTEGKDVSIDIADIKVIRIVKKSKALLRAGIGLFGGAAIGAVVGSELLPKSWWWDEATEVCTVIGGLAFGIIFGIIGALLGKDKTIQIEGMSDLEINEVLDKLRKKARIRDYK